MFSDRQEPDSGISLIPMEATASGKALLPGSGLGKPNQGAMPDESLPWLGADPLLCACPECGAPLSVRRWLFVADCWQCGTSIALTEEQLREAIGRPVSSNSLASPPAEDRLKTRQRSRPPTPVPPPVPMPPEPMGDTVAAGRDRRTVLRSATEHPSVRNETIRRPSRVRARLQQAAKDNPVDIWIHRLFRTLPAWLVSALFHLFVLILLALWAIESRKEEPFIVLATELSRDRQEGGVEEVLDPADEVRFDLPIPSEHLPTDPTKREALIRADQEARQLRIDPDAAEPQLPELHKVKSTIASQDKPRRMLAVRDPRVRVEMIKKEGGTTLTEAAVARGLRWMAQHQNGDGSWSLHAFGNTPDCQGRCGHAGSVRSDAAGTSLVLLPFLGAGQTHLVGQYQEEVSHGLRWLIERQKADGDLRHSSTGNSGMYAHGQAAIVLCEALAMTGDEQLHKPAQKAIDFIVEGQHAAGGWRYNPGQPGDTSVLGWQLMALQSARAGQLHVPDHTLENAGHYLDSVAHNDGARYAYMPNQAPTHVMTAEALLCRMYLGWTMSDPGLAEGIEWLVNEHPPRADNMNMYYWYYATQAMHHVGSGSWSRWNLWMRDALVESQQLRGHEAGSWTPRHQHGAAGGRLYATALATCILEVYYRHAPIFRQIELE